MAFINVVREEVTLVVILANCLAVRCLADMLNVLNQILVLITKPTSIEIIRTESGIIGSTIITFI